MSWRDRIRNTYTWRFLNIYCVPQSILDELHTWLDNGNMISPGPPQEKFIEICDKRLSRIEKLLIFGEDYNG